VGLRYTHDDKSDHDIFAGAFLKPANWDPSIYVGKDEIRQLAAGIQPCVAKTSPAYIPFQRCGGTEARRPNLSNDELGGKLGLQYHFTEDAMLYGSYSRGFKSGKFDLEFLHTDDTPFPQRPLDPETLDAFELGFKSTLANNTLLFNAAVFYNIWKDQQVFNVGVNGPEFFNLPESKIKGAEVELNWVPAAHWLVNANLGLLDTEITDVTGIDFDLRQGDFQKGHELPLSPKVTANAGLSRAFALGANELSLHADVRYQSTSKVKFSPQVPIDEYESRTELNARAAYEFGSSKQYELALFGNNLTGEKYCVEIQDLRGVSGSFYCVPNDGEARYGIQGRVNF
jgi:iron complex outermembrane receptor protein